VNMLYNFYPVIIYGLRQSADSNYYFKNNAGDSIQGSQTFIGNESVISNHIRYDCSVIRNKSLTAEHTIYYSNIGLIRKVEIDTIDNWTYDPLTGQLVFNGKVATTYITEILETH
jgi:hypothetical protein